MKYWAWSSNDDILENMQLLLCADTLCTVLVNAEVKFYSRPSCDSGWPQRDADLNTAVFSLTFPCDAAISEAELGKL